MKIQCACGTKYSFDITPEMAKAPIKLICQNCGQDNSEAINQVIQHQYGAASSSQPAAGKTAPAPVIVPPPPGARIVSPSPAGGAAVPAIAKPALRVGLAASPAPAASASVSGAPAAELCDRHSNQAITHHCRVCEKPMCPKCMEVFGFVCSAYCKGKAENQGIDLPRFSGQRALVQAKQTQWIGRAIGGAFALCFVSMAAWAWYAWVGSVPKVAASLRLPEPAVSGQLHMVGKEQAVFLHRGKLTRHDFKENKEVWSVPLLDEQSIVAESKATYKKFAAEREQILKAGGELNGELGTLEEMIEGNKMYATTQLRLHAVGETIWISSPGKITRFDWAAGTPSQDIPLEPGERRIVASGDELLVALANSAVLHVNLLTGETRTDRVPGSEAATPKISAAAASNSAKPTGTAAANTATGSTNRRNLTPQERAVRPALTAASANQQRLATELQGSSPRVQSAKITFEPTAFRLIVSRYGAFQISRKESGIRMVDGESVMMHQVAWRRVGGGESAEWSGEVSGYPEMHALQSVDVLIAGQTALAFDKSNKKVWETKLGGGVRGPSAENFQPENSPMGEGPCVEKNGVVYICHTGGLTAFEVMTGNQLWRLECPEIGGLVFDDKEGIYANSSTTLGDKAYAMVQKINSKTGKVLWHVEREGAVRYAAGKFVYAVDSYKGDADESDGLPGMKTIFHVSPFVSIKRLDPVNGRVMWNHFQQRFPLDVHFDKNSFDMLFKKEVQVLKFISL